MTEASPPPAGKPPGSILNAARIARAFRFSFQGVRHAWRNEVAFRQEMISGLFFVPMTFVIGSGWVEQALLLGTYLVVIIVELVNSAIEAVVDRFGGEVHPLSGAAKDLGWAAVLVSLILLAVVWLPALRAFFF